MEEQITPIKGNQSQEVPVQPPKKSSLPVIAILLIVILLVGGGVIYAVNRFTKPKICTMEAKICPDGSTVGRSGPSCEFAPCPTQGPTTTATPDETAN